MLAYTLSIKFGSVGATMAIEPPVTIAKQVKYNFGTNWADIELP